VSRHKPSATKRAERELVNIKLAADGRARVLISGRITPEEIDKLIRSLSLQRDLLSGEPESLARSDPPDSATEDSAELTEMSVKDENEARFPFFITKRQKTLLRERGYSDQQISQMKPEEAHKILGLIN